METIAEAPDEESGSHDSAEGESDENSLVADIADEDEGDAWALDMDEGEDAKEGDSLLRGSM